jgi:hypothetical protein
MHKWTEVSLLHQSIMLTISHLEESNTSIARKDSIMLSRTVVSVHFAWNVVQNPTCNFNISLVIQFVLFPSTSNLTYEIPTSLIRKFISNYGSCHLTFIAKSKISHESHTDDKTQELNEYAVSSLVAFS